MVGHHDTMNSVPVIIAACLIPLVFPAESHAQTPTNAPPRVSITFLGFTNNIRSAAAVFRFTNATPQKVFLQVTAFEYKDQSVWKTAPSPQGTSLTRAPDGSYHVQNGNMGFAAGVGFSHSLAPSSALTQEFDVHDTNVIWRIQAFCVEDATGLPGLVERGKEVVKKVQTGKNVEILSGKKYIATGQTRPE